MGLYSDSEPEVAGTAKVFGAMLLAATAFFFLTYERDRETEAVTTARIANCEHYQPPYPEGSDCEFFARVKAQIEK